MWAFRRGRQTAGGIGRAAASGLSLGVRLDWILNALEDANGCRERISHQQRLSLHRADAEQSHRCSALETRQPP